MTSKCCSVILTFFANKDSLEKADKRLATYLGQRTCKARGCGLKIVFWGFLLLQLPNSWGRLDWFRFRHVNFQDNKKQLAMTLLPPHVSNRPKKMRLTCKIYYKRNKKKLCEGSFKRGKRKFQPSKGKSGRRMALSTPEIFSKYSHQKVFAAQSFPESINVLSCTLYDRFA